MSERRSCHGSASNRASPRCLASSEASGLVLARFYLKFQLKSAIWVDGLTNLTTKKDGCSLKHMKFQWMSKTYTRRPVFAGLLVIHAIR